MKKIFMGFIVLVFCLCLIKNVSSAEWDYTGVSYDISPQSPFTKDIQFNGTNWLVLNQEGFIYVYDSKWNYLNVSYELSEINYYNCFYFNGTNWFVYGVDGVVYIYNSEFNYTGISYDTSAQDVGISGIYFNGTNWIEVASVWGPIYVYDPEFNYTGISYDITGTQIYATSLYFKDDKWYIGDGIGGVMGSIYIYDINFNYTGVNYDFYSLYGTPESIYFYDNEWYVDYFNFSEVEEPPIYYAYSNIYVFEGIEEETIIPIWYISAPENEAIINEKYFDIEVGYNISEYPEYELAGFEFLIYKDEEEFEYINMKTNTNGRAYLENGDYCYNVNMRLTEIENPENELNLDISMYQYGLNCLTMNGSYERPYVFYIGENIANNSEINNNTLILYWDYNGTMDIWSGGFWTSIEIQKDLGEGYEMIDGIYFEDNRTTNAEVNFGNNTGDYRFVMYLEVEDNESNFYGFYDDTQTLYYTILGLSEEELEPEEETIEQKLNIQNRFVVLITILLVFSFGAFLIEKFGKKGTSKLSIYLIMLFALSLKVLAVTYDYARENNLLNLVTIILILCFVFYIYQKVFKNK